MDGKAPPGQLSDQAGLSRRRIVGDVLVQVAGRVLSLGLGIAVTLLIIHRLGDSGFGQWSTVLATTQIMLWTAEFGLSRVAVARASSRPEEQGELIGALLALRMMLAVPATLVCVGVVLAISTTEEMRIAGLLLAGTVALTGPSALTAVFELRVRNDVATALLLVNNVLWAGVVVWVVLSDAGIVALAAGMLAVTAVTTVISLWLGLRMLKISMRGSRGHWRELATAGLATGVGGGLITAYVRIDQLLVFQFAGTREAGLYAAVYRILDQGQFIPGAVTTTMMPVIARTLGDYPARARRLVQRTAEYLAIASLPALAFSIAAAGPTVQLLFGAQFAEAAPALPVLMGAFVFVSLGYLTGNLVVVLDLQRRLVAIAGAGLAVNILLNVLLIPAYGFLAAAWVTLATEVVVFGLAARLVFKGLSYRPSVARPARACAAAVGMGLIVWAADRAGAPVEVLLGIAPVAYLALLFALRALTGEEVRTLLRKEVPT